MGKKLLSILAIGPVIVVILILSCSTSAPRQAEYERIYPALVKGFWLPALASAPPGVKVHSINDSPTIKEFNANLAAFTVAALYNDKGEIDLPSFQHQLAATRNLVKEYHRNNIAVFIVMEASGSTGEPGPIPEGILRSEKFASQYDSCLAKLITLAE